jgi:hypothetical protein
MGSLFHSVKQTKKKCASSKLYISLTVTQYVVESKHIKQRLKEEKKIESNIKNVDDANACLTCEITRENVEGKINDSMITI